MTDNSQHALSTFDPSFNRSFHSYGKQCRATLIYTYPLPPYLKLMDSMKSSNNETVTNTFLHQTSLSDASVREVIRPNTDTLYSPLLIDISSQDVVFTIPDMGDRFYVFPFYDLYANDFANIGQVSNSTPGDYLVKFNPDSPGLKPGDDTYAGYINMPTVYGLVNGRILVKNSSDVPNVVELQQQFIVTPVDRTYNMPFKAPPLTWDLVAANLSGSTPTEQLLKLGARLTPYNPPEVSSDVDDVNATLSQAGFHDGVYTAPVDVDLATAAVDANRTVDAWSRSEDNMVLLGTDWNMVDPSVCGDFKSAYTARAYVAEFAYLMLTVSESLYVSYIGTQCTDLGEGRACLMTFSEVPAVTGFWSITVYDSDGFLVPNDLDRYALGDRSELAYNSDGTFQLLLQAENSTPPSNWTSNWIPTPDDGVFNFLLRLYGPDDGLLDGSYVYPVIEAVDDILA